MIYFNPPDLIEFDCVRHYTLHSERGNRILHPFDILRSRNLHRGVIRRADDRSHPDVEDFGDALGTLVCPVRLNCRYGLELGYVT